MELIYIVEDDENISELISATLKASSYEVKAFSNYDDLCCELKKEIPNLFILDIMLPGISGLEIITNLKNNPATSAVPVIFLSAKSSELDKVKGLELGADDYITKPFGILELSARVKTALRRNKKSSSNSNFIIDTNSKEVFVKGIKVKLTFKEFELLEYLYQNAGIVLSRDKILDAVWGYNYEGDTTRTVDMHIKSLRQKLGENMPDTQFIETVRGYGYKFSKEYKNWFFCGDW